jgi:hypothetical protein
MRNFILTSLFGVIMYWLGWYGTKQCESQKTDQDRVQEWLQSNGYTWLRRIDDHGTILEHPTDDFPPLDEDRN